MNVRRRNSGFTMAELIVAVGAVALLTVGVGQIFSSVSGLVSQGSALAEVEQLARAIEAQLRDDFNAMNNFERSEDTFLAIRGRRIGDVDADGQLDSGAWGTGIDRERAIYLTSEDRDADLREGIDPYEPGSRAVTRRLDEILFLARSGTGGIYRSYESTCDNIDPFDASRVACETCERDITADTVRIYYGHGLRTVPDIDFDPAEAIADNYSRTPLRQYSADGDFGAGPGEDNRFDPSNQSGPANGSAYNFGESTGRNEYAGDWTLLRQATLLFGGLAAGERVGTNTRAIICNDREYAPYLRDVEAELRFGLFDDNAYSGEAWAVFKDNTGLPLPGSAHNPIDGAHVRLLRHGRTDICAQSPEDLKRWIEGFNNFEPNSDPQAGNTAFSGGRWNEVNTLGIIQKPDLLLYSFNSPVAGANASVPPDALINQYPIDVGVRSAIVGMFSRFLCDTEPPYINRDDNLNPDDACDAPMDLHAVLATRCSNFEVAWGEVSTRWNSLNAPAITDLDGNGEDDLFLEFGDIIWFDWLLPRRALYAIAPNPTSVPVDRQPGAGLETDPEVLNDDAPHYQPLMAGGPTGFNLLNGGSDRENKVLIRGQSFPGSGIPLPTPNRFQGYDWRMTGGVPDEYLAIWPYHTPDVGSSGADRTEDLHNGGMRKPDYIRIRVTLHDSQMRLKDGKDFEFVFNIDLN